MRTPTEKVPTASSSTAVGPDTTPAAIRSARWRALRRAVTVVLAAATLGTSAATASMLAGPAVSAATYTVTSAADSGEGTLRAAIDAANANPGADVIDIGDVGTITLASQLPALTGDLSIVGLGTDTTVIDGGGNRIFVINRTSGSQISLNVSDMTLLNGSPWQYGLLWNIWGNVHFDSVEIREMSPQAIYTHNGGTFRLTNSVVTDNVGPIVSSDHGNTPSSTAAESTYQNRTYITDSTFQDNTGWCVIYTERRLYLQNTTIEDNTGSAVCAQGLNGAQLRSSTITRNGGVGVSLYASATSAVTQNEVLIDDMTIYDNGGVGLNNGYITNTSGSWQPWDPPALVIRNSTIFGNLTGSDLGGTAIDPARITDSLISIPRPPSGVEGTADEDGFDVSWQAPSSDSGSAITSYTVTASPGGTTCTSPSTTCRFDGLDTSVARTFTVVATNANGDSWVSAASDEVGPFEGSPATTTPPTTAPPTTAPPTTAPPTTAPPTTAPPTAPPAAAPVETTVPGDPSTESTGDGAPRWGVSVAGTDRSSAVGADASTPTAVPAQLAFTGARTTWLALLGVVLLLMGTLLLASRPRRHEFARTHD